MTAPDSAEPLKCNGSYCHGHQLALPEHTCPFKEEIGDDYETKCTCCDYCRHECAMDI